MKKLLSVLISIGLLNIILLGVSQGNTKIKNDYEILAERKEMILEYEQSLTLMKMEILKYEKFVNSFKEESSFLDWLISGSIIKDMEIRLYKMKFTELEAEIAIDKAKASTLEFEAYLQTQEHLEFEKILHMEFYKNNKTEL